MEKLYGKFEGFSKETFKFLFELGFNNNKSWFEENKQRYQDHVIEPFRRFVTDMSGFMLSIDPDFETRPAIGKTISRIYRDVRFSKNKNPYRTNVWITFKRSGRDWVIDPCFFFEIFPDMYRYGMGYYVTPKEALERLRELIDNNDPEFTKLNKIYHRQNDFVMEGERYKKLYAGTKPEDLLDWYQRKNIYFMCTRNIDNEIFSEKITETVKKCFTELVPFYKFLWRIRLEGEAKF